MGVAGRLGVAVGQGGAFSDTNYTANGRIWRANAARIQSNHLGLSEIEIQLLGNKHRYASRRKDRESELNASSQQWCRVCLRPLDLAFDRKK
jgi:hypothetical protein